MTNEVAVLLGEAEMARAMYNVGNITREEAVAKIKPYADAFNSKSKEIAKKYGRKPQRFNLASFLR